jgi:hypothetical protein
MRADDRTRSDEQFPAILIALITENAKLLDYRSLAKNNVIVNHAVSADRHIRSNVRRWRNDGVGMDARGH